jgi:uncharacterized protein (TIGR02186 family)
MMARLSLIVAILIAFGAPISAASQSSEPKLVPDVSQRKISIQSSFTGANLLLFGAIIYPQGVKPEGKIDVAVVLRGPSQAITLREKQRILGIWVNADSHEFLSVPGYYAVAASGPLDKIVKPRTADIYELGVDRLQLSPSGGFDSKDKRRFENGLVDLNERNGLFRQQKNNKVEITDSVLYRARLFVPSSVPVGSYTAETLLIRNGEVIVADDSVEIEIRKAGFEQLVTVLADRYSLLYGILAVIISLLFGWIAALIFQRI